MIITREFGYRTDYSKVEVKVGQSVVLEDNLHPKIIFAENMLLGARVRILVALEVLDSGLFENEEDAAAELTAIAQMLRNTVVTLSSVCTESATNSTPILYARKLDFGNEAKFLNNSVKNALNRLNPANAPSTDTELNVSATF